jgi:hypothetical protein
MEGRLSRLKLLTGSEENYVSFIQNSRFLNPRPKAFNSEASIQCRYSIVVPHTYCLTGRRNLNLLWHNPSIPGSKVKTSVCLNETQHHEDVGGGWGGKIIFSTFFISPEDGS